MYKELVVLARLNRVGGMGRLLFMLTLAMAEAPCCELGIICHRPQVVLAPMNVTTTVLVQETDGTGTGMAGVCPSPIPVPCCPLYPVESGSAVPPSLWQWHSGDRLKPHLGTFKCTPKCTPKCNRDVHFADPVLLVRKCIQMY